MTYRILEPTDYGLLSSSLATDAFHADTNAMFFIEPETICTVYEDEKGPVLFLRGKAFEKNGYKCIRLDIQFVFNTDGRRNLKVMSEGFPELANKAQVNGFAAIVFESSTPILRKFCIKRLGFEESIDDWLVKVL